MGKYFNETNLVSLICIVWSIFQIYSTLSGLLNPYLQYSIHLTFGMVLVWFLYPLSKEPTTINKILKIILPLISIFLIGYVGFNYEEISIRIPRVSPLSTLDIVVAICAVILLLEATRRVVGMPLVVVCLVFLLYTYFGRFIPGSLGHGGYSLGDIADYIYYTTEGVWGVSLRISATYLFLFVIYAEIIKACGAGDFFMDLAKAIAGALRGGPAQIAVISSALFGGVTGSALANVYATGAFTIPMMKKLGYEPAFAGAVEAYASTGGQITPPIMAATAFIMAEFIGVSYWDVCVLAFVPAMLYFLCGNMQIFFEAHKKQLLPLPKEDRPAISQTLKSGSHTTIPLIFLIVGLATGYSIGRTVVISMLVAIIVSWFRKDTRMTPIRILQALDKGARNGVMIAISCAAVGVILAVFVIAGLGIALTQVIYSLGGGIPVWTAVLIAVMCFILGMGMPTLPAYVITAALGMPVMDSVGFPTGASHLFVLYFAIMSMITPPVCISAYAAASIAGGNPLKIGWRTVRLGIGGFLVPFFALYYPGLLLQGGGLEIVDTIITAILALFMVSSALNKYFFRNISYWECAILFFGCLSFLFFGPMYCKLIGLGIIIFMLRKHFAARFLTAS